LTGSTATNIYRIRNNASDTINKRMIWANQATVNLTLNPGHYWIEWMVGTTSGISSNFSPFSTFPGQPTQIGNNARSRNIGTGVISAIQDQGSGYAQDMPFKVLYVSQTPACSGTPDPGNTLSSQSFVCPGQDFQLSLQNNPLLTGLQYQWQLSADNISWNDIGGANGIVHTQQQNNSQWYRCQVSCGSNVSYSNPVFVPLSVASIQTQPSNTIAYCGEPVIMQIGISAFRVNGNYQWQQKTGAAASWTDLNNSISIKGANDDSLQFLLPTVDLNGYYYRARYTDSCGNVLFSDSAQLTVNQARVVINPNVLNACSQQIQMLKLQGSKSFLTQFTQTPPTPINIPDTAAAGILSNLAVSGIPAEAVITGITVNLNISHSSVGDLAITLKSPNGKIINLDYYLTGTIGGSTSNGFINTSISSNGSSALSGGSNPFTGFFRADMTVSGAVGAAGPASLLPNSQNWQDLYSGINGNWTLGVYDGQITDLGALNSWGLSFTYVLKSKATWTSTVGGTLFSNASATLPYVPGTWLDTVYVKTGSTSL
jgi:subtilisin-like proprotein convertase family protein